jgi:hypothetical protein
MAQAFALGGVPTQSDIAQPPRVIVQHRFAAVSTVAA